MFNLNKPTAATWEEWDSWKEEAKKSHPIKYFLLETLPIKLGRTKRRIKDIIYWIKYRTVSKHKYHLVKTGLKPNYYDKDTLILYACFNLLKDFVEVEKPFDHFETEGKEYWKEISDLYKWWTVIRPNRKEIEKPPIDNGIFSDPKNLEWAIRWNNIEEKCDKEDEEMLIRLMKVRLHLWT